jgi:hypothetical protein
MPTQACQLPFAKLFLENTSASKIAEPSGAADEINEPQSR